MMARPKMTEQQKADAKAAREAAKAGAPAAADRAEARAASKKPPTDAPKAPVAPRGVNPEFDQEEKALFLQFMPEVRKLRELLATANSNLRNKYKSAKAQGGFTKADFDTAFALETAEKEAKERAAIARKLKVAKMCGSSLGNQLDMFLEPDRTPIADRAFEEGESDAMQNIAARPSYDPSTEAYRRYLEGFHSVSERRIKEGMGTLHSEVEADEIEKAKHQAEMDALKARDAKAFEGYDQEAAGAAAMSPVPSPSSGVPMTRAQFKAQPEASKAASTKH
jgi:hypothetical protein